MRPARRFLFTTLSFLGLTLLISAISGGYRLEGLGPWSYQSDLQLIVENALAGEDGYYGVAVKHLVSGEEALYNSNHQFVAASLYKLAVFYAAYWQRDRGELSFDELLIMNSEAGVLTEDEAPSIPMGGAIDVKDALAQMITLSDNSSTILLLQRIGAKTVNGLVNELGLTQTEVGVSDLALTSPQDILLLLEKIYRGSEQSSTARQEMVCTLLRQTINDRLPRYLPVGTPVAHKTGNLGDIAHDAGIVFGPDGPYVIVVMAEGLTDPEQGTEVIARLSRTIYDYFGSRSEGTPFPSPSVPCYTP